MSELRRDPVSRQWVIVAPSRSLRPSDPQPDGVCPFCPGNEYLTPDEVLGYREPGSAPNRPGWWVRAFPNRYPVLSDERDAAAPHAAGMYDVAPALGRHEVVVETPDHDADFATMPHDQLAEVFWAYRDRLRALQADAALAHILFFRNYGAAAGASLAHPHTQIIAGAVVPPDVTRAVEHLLAYFAMRGRCAGCDAIAQETADPARVVSRNDGFIAFAPFASRVAFEIRIMPLLHHASFAQLDRPGVERLAEIVRETGARLRALHGAGLAYNLILRVAPRWESSLEGAFHWSIELLPRLSALPAGFELGTGTYITSVAPEHAAALLREVTADAPV